MELKLKKDLQETYIYVPFINNNVMGKFIDEGLYPYLYKIAPDLFDVVEVKENKKIIIDDILINNSTEEGDIAE
jgi:hypothetical protein